MATDLPPPIAEHCPACGGVRGLTQPGRRVCRSAPECMMVLYAESTAYLAAWREGKAARAQAALAKARGS